jgi:hypothetical protein
MGWVGLWCLTPLSIISPLYSGGQFLKLRKGPEILKWRTEREILMASEYCLILALFLVNELPVPNHSYNYEKLF